MDRRLSFVLLLIPLFLILNGDLFPIHVHGEEQSNCFDEIAEYLQKQSLRRYISDKLDPLSSVRPKVFKCFFSASFRNGTSLHSAKVLVSVRGFYLKGYPSDKIWEETPLLLVNPTDIDIDVMLSDSTSCSSSNIAYHMVQVLAHVQDIVSGWSKDIESNVRSDTLCVIRDGVDEDEFELCYEVEDDGTLSSYDPPPRDDNVGSFGALVAIVIPLALFFNLLSRERRAIPFLVWLCSGHWMPELLTSATKTLGILHYHACVRPYQWFYLVFFWPVVVSVLVLAISWWASWWPVSSAEYKTGTFSTFVIVTVVLMLPLCVSISISVKRMIGKVSWNMLDRILLFIALCVTCVISFLGIYHLYYLTLSISLDPTGALGMLAFLQAMVFFSYACARSILLYILSPKTDLETKVDPHDLRLLFGCLYNVIMDIPQGSEPTLKQRAFALRLIEKLKNGDLPHVYTAGDESHAHRAVYIPGQDLARHKVGKDFLVRMYGDNLTDSNMPSFDTLIECIRDNVLFPEVETREQQEHSYELRRVGSPGVGMEDVIARMPGGRDQLMSVDRRGPPKLDEGDGRLHMDDTQRRLFWKSFFEGFLTLCQDIEPNLGRKGFEYMVWSDYLRKKKPEEKRVRNPLERILRRRMVGRGKHQQRSRRGRSSKRTPSAGGVDVESGVPSTPQSPSRGGEHVSPQVNLDGKSQTADTNAAISAPSAAAGASGASGEAEKKKKGSFLSFFGTKSLDDVEFSRCMKGPIDMRPMILERSDEQKRVDEMEFHLRYFRAELRKLELGDDRDLFISRRQFRSVLLGKINEMLSFVRWSQLSEDTPSEVVEAVQYIERARSLPPPALDEDRVYSFNEVLDEPEVRREWELLQKKVEIPRGWMGDTKPRFRSTSNPEAVEGGVGFIGDDEGFEYPDWEEEHELDPTEEELRSGMAVRGLVDSYRREWNYINRRKQELFERQRALCQTQQELGDLLVDHQRKMTEFLAEFLMVIILEYLAECEKSDRSHLQVCYNQLLVEKERIRVKGLGVELDHARVAVTESQKGGDIERKQKEKVVLLRPLVVDWRQKKVFYRKTRSSQFTGAVLRLLLITAFCLLLSSVFNDRSNDVGSGIVSIMIVSMCSFFIVKVSDWQQESQSSRMSMTKKN
eukprot:TRINITY_DN121_c0_g1_i1.p1 TRINITY_DN121_c0_g1~~TRINITY_DN121_c0_g1_i1.p1  ORF type:complete len:1187 (-),score=315.58 TRINITY_DN121_c0_g1_i1:1992-5417(-)